MPEINTTTNEELKVRIVTDSENCTFVANPDDTIYDVCSHADVIGFLGQNADGITIENADDALEHLVSLNGNTIPVELRPFVIKTPVSPDMTIAFDIDTNNFAGEQTATEEAADGATDGAAAPEAAPAEPQVREGVVHVETNGGMQETTVPIKVGITTVYEVIFTDKVRKKSGMTDAQLSAAGVLYNEVGLPDNLVKTQTLQDGDRITLTARSPYNKYLG